MVILKDMATHMAIIITAEATMDEEAIQITQKDIIQKIRIFFDYLSAISYTCITILKVKK